MAKEHRIGEGGLASRASAWAACAMAQRKHWNAIRNARLFRPVLWLALAFAGIVGGMVVGELAAGDRPGLQNRGAVEGGGFARLSANPGALTADPTASPPCRDCADSYGVAAQLRAQRTERANGSFRDPAAVDLDAPLSEPADDYRYGGRFPDIAPPVDTPETALPGDATTPD